jgi:molecular chaperone GrpE
MSGRPDHAAARWADDAEGGAGEAGTAPVPGAASARVGAAAPQDGRVAADEGGAGVAEAATGHADGGGAVGGDQILADVAAISAQRDEYLESLQRLKADFDNYRKRVARLQEEQSARAEANLIGKLLPVIDNLDLAWAHLGPRDEDGQGEGGSVSEEARAIGQARGQLLDVLGKEGLERVDAVGVPFDPTVHDAVAHTEVDGKADGNLGVANSGAVGGGPADEVADGGGAGGPVPHTVSVDEVLRAGYRWRGQVLRPAMVRVRG